MSPASHPPIRPHPAPLQGSWVRLPRVVHASAVFSFSPLPGPPLSSCSSSSASSPSPPHLHQVALEVGDECCLLEHFLPLSPTPGPPPQPLWYRGYVLSLALRPASLPPPVLLSSALAPLAPSQSLPFPSSSLSHEPLVFLGIFPASHLQLRLHTHLASPRPPSPLQSSSLLAPLDAPPSIPSFSKHSSHMDPLQEEDESDLIHSFSFSRHSFSLSLAPFCLASPPSRPTSRLRSAPRKLPIPLPSLKAGDETLSGRDEPLVDEIACALREWSTLLYVHLHRRRYALFHAVQEHIDVLHVGRRQLLARSLSTEEASHLRPDLVLRLLAGNLLQGLDIILRHPDYGALVDCEANIEALDSRSWMSAIRMYVAQARLAYLNQAIIHSPGSGLANLGLSDVSSNHTLSLGSFNHLSKLYEPNQIPLNAHLPSSRSNRSAFLSKPSSQSDHPSSSPRLALNKNSSLALPSGPPKPKFFHVLLEVKSLLANPCSEGEVLECYFSLYNKSESRFLTEEYCLVLNHLGLPLRSKSKPNPNLNSFSVSVSPNTPSNHPVFSAKTIFRDLSQHDLQDSIFLVCRLVKNGSIKIASAVGSSSLGPMSLSNDALPTAHSSVSSRYELESSSPSQSSIQGTALSPPLDRSANSPPQKYALPDANGEYSGMTFWQSRTGTQSVRRPYGCAVVEIPQFSLHSSTQPFTVTALSTARTNTSVSASNGVLESPVHQFHMNIFSPVREATFPTLHEDIIASRVKEFLGSGNLASYGGGGGSATNSVAGGGGFSSKPSVSTLNSQLGAKNESVAIEIRTYYGDATSIIKENGSALSEIPLTCRLGFPDVVFPDDARNEIYIKFWAGDFSHLHAGTTAKMMPSNGSAGKNIEVAAEVRTKNGRVLEGVISRGAGEAKVTRYNSVVYRNNSTPTWGELMKLHISSDLIEDCYLFFTFRNRGERPNRNNAQLPLEKPFAFAFLPLYTPNKTFIPDGEHSLVLFKNKNGSVPEVYSKVCASLDEVQVVPEVTSALMKLLVPLKDNFHVRSFLCSTRHTQNEVLLKLMKWQELLDDPVGLQETLTQLKFTSEVEICKFLRNIFDALFGVLVSRVNTDHKEYDDLVFNALVTLLGIVSDRRFTNFKPVVDLYIEQHFSCSTASCHLIKSLQNLLLNPTSPHNAQPLRSSIKVWAYLMRFIIRSRELQCTKGSGTTSGELIPDTIESKFRTELISVLNSINGMMTVDSSAIIGTQTLAVQHYASLIPELLKVFSPLELLDHVDAFCESIVATKGKIVMWTLLLQEHIVMSSLFDEPEGRLRLVPKLVGWVKPYLGEFVDYAIKPQDSEAVKDSSRVTWLEGIRISTAVVAVALDRLHEALVDPQIHADPSALAQEHDNVEYLLGLLPKLLDSVRELENPLNVEAVQRVGTTASVISPVPVVFPASYPFSLLNSWPGQTTGTLAGVDDGSGGGGGGDGEGGGSLTTSALPLTANPPTTQNALGEVSIVLLTMVLISPNKSLEGHLEMMLEVEGMDNLAGFLQKWFKVFYLILRNKAFPSNWLNVNALAHKVTMKVLVCVSKLMITQFIPTSTSNRSSSSCSLGPSGATGSRFNSELWSDFFVLIHALLSSHQLVLEEYPPQKRRAVWKLTGDLRSEGSQIFRASWEALGNSVISVGFEGNVTRCGGYQVQFVPGFIEPLLELCLSHHDEMRSNAVIVLYGMIISEYRLNGNFTLVANEIIDKLDKLLGNSTSHLQTDEFSKSCFVVQLRTLFLGDSAEPKIPRVGESSLQPEASTSYITAELKVEVERFLDSLTQFLDLLLGIRSLPPGDEFIDDRVIGTLKLMSFLRNIGRSGIYIHYVHKLVNFHEASGNYVEAGFALRLHADLHEWDISTVLEAMPELSLPKQTAFARKEALYLRILEYLSRGKAWESGIQICKELQHQYEHVSFDYERLAEVLVHQSTLYQKIVKTDRFFCEYFRVAFYGQGFPPSVQNRQFVYRGHEWEKYAAFCDRMNNKHPNAQILRTGNVPIEELQYADGQFLNITKVSAEPDRSAVVFINSEVPTAVRSYYEHNATNTFSYLRPFNKEDATETDPIRMWFEKTFLVCEDSFPTVLQRSEVLEIRVLEISPIENAIIMTNQKTLELQNLYQRYVALSKTTEAGLNTNPLSMTLNSLVDAPANTGVLAYKQAFLDPERLPRDEQDKHLADTLQEAVDQHTVIIDHSLTLHGLLCPPEMKGFHVTLYEFFIKNFAEEIARLPIDPSVSPLINRLTEETDRAPNLGLASAESSIKAHVISNNPLHGSQGQRPVDLSGGTPAPTTVVSRPGPKARPSNGSISNSLSVRMSLNGSLATGSHLTGSRGIGGLSLSVQEHGLAGPGEYGTATSPPISTRSAQDGRTRSESVLPSTLFRSEQPPGTQVSLPAVGARLNGPGIVRNHSVATRSSSKMRLEKDSKLLGNGHHPKPQNRRSILSFKFGVRRSATHEH